MLAASAHPCKIRHAENVVLDGFFWLLCPLCFTRPEYTIICVERCCRVTLLVKCIRLRYANDFATTQLTNLCSTACVVQYGTQQRSVCKCNLFMVGYICQLVCCMHITARIYWVLHVFLFPIGLAQYCKQEKQQLPVAVRWHYCLSTTASISPRMWSTVLHNTSSRIYTLYLHIVFVIFNAAIWERINHFQSQQWWCNR